MSATAGKTSPTQEILGKIHSIETRVAEQKSAIDGLMDLVKQPASRAGYSPQELIAKSVHSGPGTFGPDGGYRAGRYNPRGPRMEPVAHPATGKSTSFGEFLTHQRNLAVHGLNATKSVEYLDGFGVKAVREERDVVYKTALAESSGVTGGYTVPPVFVNQLLRLALEESIVEPRATKQPLTSRTVQVPSLDVSTKYSAGQSPILGGVVQSFAAEAATRKETEPQFRQTTLTAWEYSSYTVASNTLLADNAVGLEALLTQLFADSIAWGKDYSFFNGTGVGQPLGLLNAPATIQVTKAAAGHIRYADISQMLSKLYWMLRGGDSLVWVGHQSIIPEIHGMTDNSAGSGAGRLVFQPYNQGAQEKVAESAGVQSFGYLAGRPLILTEKVPALGTLGCLSLFDLSKYLVGQRMELEIAVSPHVNFLNNQTVWRCVARFDGQPWLSGPITLADGAYQVSPFVTLTQ